MIYLQLEKQHHRPKIEQHLSKFVNINSPFWLITSGTFQKMQFGKIAPKIKAYFITSLVLNNNLYSPILKQIQGGCFQYLVVLSLSNNCLVSIECLSNFNAPSLQALYLDKNLLISLRSLRKWVPRGLKILDVSMNHLTSLAPLTEFNSFHLLLLNLSRNDHIVYFEPFLKSIAIPPQLSLSQSLKTQIGPACFPHTLSGSSSIKNCEGVALSTLVPNFDIFKSRCSMTEAEIAEIWGEVNDILQLQCGRFNLKQLCGRGWYLSVLEAIYPFMNDRWAKVHQVQSEEAAINLLLLSLHQEEIIEEDFLEIKGRDVVIGDVQSIFYIVQLLSALVERALEEAEMGQVEGDGMDGEGEEIEGEEKEDEGESDRGYSHLQQQYSSNPQPQQDRPQYGNAPRKEMKGNDSEHEEDKGCHSVLGIGHQFQQDQHQSEQSQRQPAFNNVFPVDNDQQARKMKITNCKSEQEQEHDPQHYLQQKLQKHKSQQQLHQHKSQQHARQQKQLARKKSPKLPPPPPPKKLIAHPQIPKTIPKTITTQQKKLTETVKKSMMSTKKQSNARSKENIAVGRAGGDEIERKRRELGNYLSHSRRIKREQMQQRATCARERNSAKLKKLLKWKEANLQRQKLELQLDMQAKVQLKKELYVRKVNQLIITLEKKRNVQLRQEEKQRQRREKEEADRRLEAIEQQYRNQMRLLQEKSGEKKRVVMQTDHKAIVEGLEKELKRENQKQMIGIQMRFRREEAQLEDDLEQLQQEIIRAYKKH